MEKEQIYKIIKKIIIGLAIIISIAWISLTGIVLYSFYKHNTVDVSRRVTAPNKQKTAILVRDWNFDLNFKLCKDQIGGWHLDRKSDQVKALD